jgi:DNA-directed RNA polymerase specialized sigma24 family protein
VLVQIHTAGRTMNTNSTQTAQTPIPIPQDVPRYLRDDPNRIWPDERELKPLVAAARWAARRVPIRGYESHELQWDALLRIVLDYNKIAASVSPDAFARNIAVKHLLDVWRRENRRGASYQSASQINTPTGPEKNGSRGEQSVSEILEYSAAGSIFDAWWRARATQGIFGRLRNEIRSLDAGLRRVIELFFGFDQDVGVLEVEEIAEELGLAVSTVYARRSAALKELKMRLGDLKFRRT